MPESFVRGWARARVAKFEVNVPDWFDDHDAMMSQHHHHRHHHHHHKELMKISNDYNKDDSDHDFLRVVRMTIGNLGLSFYLLP